jgi:predicted LPLAT superfamily acyltransferase
MKPSGQLERNPGPSWGAAFLQQADRWLPGPVFRFLLGMGTWIAVAGMPLQRRHSREFLAAVHGRPARAAEVWRHFLALADALVLKLRVARGVAHECTLAADGPGDFDTLMASGEPALFGTFHVGHSDLLGFLLGGRFRRPVHMIRLRMENAADTAWLGRLYAQWVRFIWVNRPDELIFAIKDAVASGGSLAMQCDRLEFATRSEPFRFLGPARLFPFTIYHLALVFDRPVIFCVGLPGPAGDRTVLHASPVFRPDRSLDREANLARARVHFQAVLNRLETLVRQSPSQWLNFLPMNPPAAGDAAGAKAP